MCALHCYRRIGATVGVFKAATNLWLNIRHSQAWKPFSHLITRDLAPWPPFSVAPTPHHAWALLLTLPLFCLTSCLYPKFQLTFSVEKLGVAFVFFKTWTWDLLSHTQGSLSMCFPQNSPLLKSLVPDVTLSPCGYLKPRSDSLLLLSSSLQPALSWLTLCSGDIAADRKNTGFGIKSLWNPDVLLIGFVTPFLDHVPQLWNVDNYNF